MSNPTDQQQKSDKAEKLSTRWWESYLVRYLLGFIIGTFCVLAIIVHMLEPAKAARLLGPSVMLLAPTFTPERGRTITIKSIGEKSAEQATETSTTYEIQESGVSAVLGIAILGLGVAYCYMASTPITVLHAGRMMRTWTDRQARGVWLGWVLSLLYWLVWGSKSTSSSVAWNLVLMVSTAVALLVIDPWMWARRSDALLPQSPPKTLRWFRSEDFSLWRSPIDRSKTRAPDERPAITLTAIGAQALLLAVFFGASSQIAKSKCFMDPMWFLLAVPALWICISQYWTLLVLLVRQERYSAFTQSLVDARSKVTAGEWRDTYTHLREHSNAVFIVVIELSLLSGIIGFLYPISADDSTLTHPIVSRLNLHAVIGAVCIWLVPTIFMWSRANFLEREMVIDTKNVLDVARALDSEASA